MRKYLIRLSVILFTVILASCNWNPTDIETGGGHGGGDKDTIVNFDSTNREFMFLEMKYDESYNFNDSNVIQVISVNSPDDSGREYLARLNLSYDKGITFTEIKLSSINPTYNDGKLEITILIVYPKAYPKGGANVRIVNL